MVAIYDVLVVIYFYGFPFPGLFVITSSLEFGTLRGPLGALEVFPHPFLAPPCLVSTADVGVPPPPTVGWTQLSHPRWVSVEEFSKTESLIYVIAI